MKSDTDTPEQKLARSNNGADANKSKSALEMIWDEVQAKNRAAGAWGAQVRIRCEVAA